EDGPITLRSREGVARENQRAPVRLVLAEAVVERRGVEERIDVEELRAGTNMIVGAFGRQIGLGFIGPQRVETLADDIVADGVPVPLGSLGVCGVDVGAGAG